MLLSFDIKNCFNAVSRARLFRELAARPKLRQLLLPARLQRRRRGRRRGGRGGSRGGVRRRGGDTAFAAVALQPTLVELRRQLRSLQPCSPPGRALSAIHTRPGSGFRV